jgi:hypothetical protein
MYYNNIIEKMFVLIKKDSPDIVIEDENQMCIALFKNLKINAAYQYINFNGTWYVSKRYRKHVDNTIIIDMKNNWECPDHYKTYEFPNICYNCKNANFMAGSYCFLCNDDQDECPDCKSRGIICSCSWNDF